MGTGTPTWLTKEQLEARFGPLDWIPTSNPATIPFVRTQGGLGCLEDVEELLAWETEEKLRPPPRAAPQWPTYPVRTTPRRR